MEKYVQFLEHDLKEKVYYSIEDINRDVQQKIADINNGKRTSQAKYFARVPNNYHLLYDDHYYSVLYTYYNQPAILKATMAEIRICDRNNKLICTHGRSYKDFPKYITKPEHMAPEHQYYKEVNSKDGAYYRRWASSIGPYMGKLIDSVLLAPQHEETTGAMGSSSAISCTI